jgi:hypothetical protein
MRKHPSCSRRFDGAKRGGLVALYFLLACTVQAQPSSAPLVSGPKSVFEDPVSKPGYTDPFFPKTKRFVPATPEPIVIPEQPIDKTQIGELKLKGISGTSGNRLALINNQTLAVGETGRVRTAQGVLNVQVIEIKDRSAVVKIEGEKEAKEIFLPPSF